MQQICTYICRHVSLYVHMYSVYILHNMYNTELTHLSPKLITLQLILDAKATLNV